MQKRLARMIERKLLIGKENAYLNRVCPYDVGDSDCGNWCPHFHVQQRRAEDNIDITQHAFVSLTCGSSTEPFIVTLVDATEETDAETEEV